MKGIVLEKARPSNILDVYALIKKAHEEDSSFWVIWKINADKLQKLYWIFVQTILPSDHAHIILARRGKQYLGLIQGAVNFNAFGDPFLFVSTAFVLKEKRKLGIGKKLADAMEEWARSMGIGSIHLICKDDLIKKWEAHGARKVGNYMIKELNA